MPKSTKKKINIYTNTQCQRIQKAAREYTIEWNPEKSVKWDLIITVALATAMRRAELLNCTWADIDFDAQTIEVNPKKNTKNTWQWLIKDADRRILPPTEEIVQMLVDHQAQQPEGYPYVFVPIARYDYIQNVLRPKDKLTLSDSRLKVVNNFKRSFDKILRKAGVKTGTFHDIRRTAISMWLANGMSEYDVMTLAGHSSFATTHKFYLAVADDLYCSRLSFSVFKRLECESFRPAAFVIPTKISSAFGKKFLHATSLQHTLSAEMNNSTGHCQQ